MWIQRPCVWWWTDYLISCKMQSSSDLHNMGSKCMLYAGVLRLPSSHIFSHHELRCQAARQQSQVWVVPQLALGLLKNVLPPHPLHVLLTAC